jgi:hypothetical protein
MCFCELASAICCGECEIQWKMISILNGIVKLFTIFPLSLLYFAAAQSRFLFLLTITKGGPFAP